MEKAFARAEEFTETLRDYVNTRVEEVKLNAVEKSSGLAGNALAGIIAGLLIFFAGIFAGFALAYAFGVWTGKTWLGFLIVAGIYLLAGIITWTAGRKFIREKIQNGFIRQLFTKDEEDN